MYTQDLDETLNNESYHYSMHLSLVLLYKLLLLQDIIVNFAMVGVLIVMLIIIIIVSLNFSSIGRDGASDAPSPLTIFLFVILPAIVSYCSLLNFLLINYLKYFIVQIVIILYGIPFVASAVISWMTCSSISNSVHEESRELGRQSSSPAADTNPHLTADCPPASLKVDDL